MKIIKRKEKRPKRFKERKQIKEKLNKIIN